MKYLLDTCVISELIKKDPNIELMNWISDIDENDLFLSVIVLGEIEKGITKLKDSKKKNELQSWFNALEKRFENRTISITKDVAMKWGNLLGDLENKGNKMPAIDCLIASSAIVNGMTIVTRNEKDIKKSGAKTYNPWG